MGVEVEHDSQIGKALKGTDGGDVCHPSAVWRGHVELTIQIGVNRQGWFTAIAAGSTLVADLRLVTR
jgi:hypothetical protein